jgi:hypothetical protein
VKIICFSSRNMQLHDTDATLDAITLTKLFKEYFIEKEEIRCSIH